MNAAIQKVKAKPLTQVTNVKELLWNDQARAQLQQVAAKHMNPERMMRLMANAMRTTPKLAECDPMSLLGGLMTCASLGLEPNTIMGHAYLIPFKNGRKGITEVQLVVGYKGLIDLARRSGHITSISANIHYDDDELWDYEEGTESRLRHKPGPQEGEKKHAYAIAKFTDGGHAYVVLPWAKVMKIRDGSQGWQTAVRYNNTAKSPWATHEDEMAKKTAIRALSKYLPLSVEFADAVNLDGGQANFADFAANPAEPLDITPARDDDDAMIEGDVGEVAPPEPEQEPEPKAQKEEPQPQPRKAPENKPQRSPDQEQFRGLVEMIKRDLLDAPSVDEVLDLYGPQIDQMKDSAPALHDELQAEIAEFQKSSG